MNQPDFSIYLIFLFGFGLPLLVLPAAYFLRRHWSVQKRLVMAPFLFAVSTILYAALIGANYRKPGNGAFACIFGALWLIQSVMLIYVWRRMSREARRAAAIGRPPPDSVDPFFWQGLLILLPVLIMALVAGTAIIKDRATVEREARQRAAEILQEINRGIVQPVAWSFHEYEVCINLWNDQLVKNSLWPGSAWRNAYAKDEALTEMTNTFLAARISPDVLEEAIKFKPAFDEDGTILDPKGGDVPKPAQWMLELSPIQLAAWNSFCRTMKRSDGLDDSEVDAFDDFIRTKPSIPARYNAEFLRRRAGITAAPASDAVTQLVSLSADFGGTMDPRHLRISKPGLEVVSETGIPISSLSLAEALRRAKESGPTEPLWGQLVREIILEPGFFTPMLLELAEPLTTNNPALTGCLEALRRRLAETERARSIAAAIQASGRIHGITTANFWLDFDNRRWFCILQPNYSFVPGGAKTNWFTEAWLFPQSALAPQFMRAIEGTGVSIPRYFGLSVKLEGEPLWEAKFNTADTGNALAEVTGRLSQPTGDGGEGLPSHPRYVIGLYVADARLMLAAQRERALIIGGLILASALAAFVGFLMARRAFYRQLRLNEMKSDFVSSVSHELRAPIASVRLMAEGLERGRISEPGKQHEYFKFIVQECRRLSSLIENVLDFSRIEQGRKQYEMESTDLVALTEKTVALMETYAAERQITIALKKSGEPTPVEMDGKAMQQALVNLIDNAIKHSPKGAEIVVGLEFNPARGVVPSPGQPEGWTTSESAQTRPVPMNRPRSHEQGHVMLWVEDRGEGIPAVEHEKIFERFYRVGSELRRETQGVGIGLSIVKHIVEAHGGRVTVRSAPGAGSRFTIEVPVSNHAGADNEIRS